MIIIKSTVHLLPGKAPQAKNPHGMGLLGTWYRICFGQALFLIKNLDADGEVASRHVVNTRSELGRTRVGLALVLRPIEGRFHERAYANGRVLTIQFK